MRTSFRVNGQPVSSEVEPRVLLVDMLRDELGLTGTKVGCDTGQCGSCVVHLNGVSTKSCEVLAVQAGGADVTTIEAAFHQALEVPRVSPVGSHPAALDVGAQVLIEVRLQVVEGDLSDQARRELMERNLALLEPLVVSLRRHLAARSNVVRGAGHQPAGRH